MCQWGLSQSAKLVYQQTSPVIDDMALGLDGAVYQVMAYHYKICSNKQQQSTSLFVRAYPSLLQTGYD